MPEEAIAEGTILGDTFLHLQGVALAGGEEEAAQRPGSVARAEDDAPGQTDILHHTLQFARGVKDDVAPPPERAVQIIQGLLGRGSIHGSLARAIL
jgi:hypothetical protein